MKSYLTVFTEPCMGKNLDTNGELLVLLANGPTGIKYYVEVYLDVYDYHGLEQKIDQSVIKNCDLTIY